jgi:serine protease Do
VTVQPLDRTTRNRLAVPPRVDGLVVTHVEPDSSAAQMGLRDGDVIVEVNRTPTPSVEAFRKALQDSDQAALLLIYRDGATLYLSLSK